jgi:hypothetical protein
MNCQHAACHCREASIEKDGRRYCSDACANAAALSSACPCGHQGCS